MPPRAATASRSLCRASAGIAAETSDGTSLSSSAWIAIRVRVCAAARSRRSLTTWTSPRSTCSSCVPPASACSTTSMLPAADTSIQPVSEVPNKSSTSLLAPRCQVPRSAQVCHFITATNRSDIYSLRKVWVGVCVCVKALHARENSVLQYTAMPTSLLFFLTII